ncbi:hypothetical protein [Sphingomonas sanxanigenens]|uniref:hypothetical protein n=1 Tax=Sphingomonas sanxanigenens TaxID=397260 RepID=UPI001301717A|nr:hypothetical protein [Sphingomonas sanxanigenens]
MTVTLRSVSRWWLRPAIGGVVFVTWLAGKMRPSRQDIYIDRLKAAISWLVERGVKVRAE